MIPRSYERALYPKSLVQLPERHGFPPHFILFFAFAKLVWCHGLKGLHVCRIITAMIILLKTCITWYWIKLRVFELSIVTASEEAWLALLTTVRCLVADGEAPPVRDEVQCSSCGRSFAPHVLVKQTNKQKLRFTVDCWFCSVNLWKKYLIIK